MTFCLFYHQNDSDSAYQRASWTYSISGGTYTRRGDISHDNKWGTLAKIPYSDGSHVTFFEKCMKSFHFLMLLSDVLLPGRTHSQGSKDLGG